MFYKARGFAGKAISAGGIIAAGTLISLVGRNGSTSIDQVTNEIRLDLATLFLLLYCTLYLIGLYALAATKSTEIIITLI